MKRRVLNLAISLDQYLTCWLSLGYYHPDATLSALAWHWEITGKRIWPRKLIDWLFSALEEDHCKKSFYAERLRPFD